MRTDNPPRLPARFAPHRRLAGGALLLALLLACSPTQTQDTDRPAPSGGQDAGSSFTCAEACAKAVETCRIPPLDVAACTASCTGLPDSERNLECIRTSSCEELEGGKCAPACTPVCQDKVCGDDGCGGSCGSCASGSTCVDGQCQSTCPVGSSPQGGACVCDPGYIRGEDCSGCVLDPENDGCSAHASRVNGQCACDKGYKLNESGCGCVPLPSCTNLYRCAYKHVHYEDGSGTTLLESTWLDQVQAQESTFQACMERKINDRVSSLPAGKRCLFQGCTEAFSESSCAGASLFTCRYKHVHYGDGSGVAYLEQTSTSLMNSLLEAYDSCVNYQIRGTPTALPPQEACKLMECRVSG